jgi:exodeoxyribonuclease (lambda-induced)
MHHEKRGFRSFSPLFPRALKIPMTDAELVQNSPEWLQARCGSVGSSEIADVMRRLKNGEPAAGYLNLMARKVAERLTGRPIGGYQSRAMLEGQIKEAAGRASYAFVYEPVTLIGLVRHPTIAGAHASPDGLVGEHGLVEIKCPEHAAHVAVLLTGTIDRDYLYQMQWQMAVTGRRWCDFVSYHPDFPPDHELYVQRFDRDLVVQAAMEGELRLFLKALDGATAKVLERA